MKINKAKDRDKKRRKDRYGMGVDGRSVKLLQQIILDRAEKIRKEREEKGKSEETIDAQT